MYAIRVMTVETIVMKAFAVCLLNSLLFNSFVKKFSTVPGALNLKPIGVDYVQTFL